MSPYPQRPTFPIDVRGGQRINVRRIGAALQVDLADGSFDNGVLAPMPTLTVKGNTGPDDGQPADVSLAILAAIGNPLGDAIGDRTKIGLCLSPWDKGANGKGGAADRAAVQACINQILTAQTIGYVGHGVIDGRGGTFAVDAAVTMSGTPYDITFQNFSLRPFGSFSGTLLDCSTCTTMTRIRFFNLALNGYEQCQKLLRLGAKTQGVWITHSSFVGFTVAGVEDITPNPATELIMFANEFQGASNANVGTAIVINGNDSYVCDNNIRNVMVGVRYARGGNAFMRNHVYSVNPNVPIPAVICATGEQMQLSNNYVDCAYFDISNPSTAQLTCNKYFMTGTVSGFCPIILRPTAAGQTLQNFMVLGETFISLFALYNPVKVDTTLGTFGSIFQTTMISCSFFGFTKMSTEPRARGFIPANAPVASVNFNFFGNIPWGSLKRISGGALNPPSSNLQYVTVQSLSGSVGFLNFSGNASGEWTMQGSVNDDFI